MNNDIAYNKTFQEYLKSVEMQKEQGAKNMLEKKIRPYLNCIGKKIFVTRGYNDLNDIYRGAKLKFGGYEFYIDSVFINKLNKRKTFKCWFRCENFSYLKIETSHFKVTDIYF